VRLSLVDGITPDKSGNPNLKRINFIRMFMVNCGVGCQVRIKEMRLVEYNEAVVDVIVSE
jgi:hypothetical protein